MSPLPPITAISPNRSASNAHRNGNHPSSEWFGRAGWTSSIAVLFVVVCLGHLPVSVADEPASADLLLTRFAQNWREDGWQKSFPRGKKGYIRVLADDGWRVRMAALRGIAALGGKSVEPLLGALEKGKTPTRVLAAQSLGFVAPLASEPDKLRTALLQSAEHDEDSAVRLYAVDALGMQGGRIEESLRPLLKTEKNGDVRRHIEYALERNGEPIEAQIVESLATFDLSTTGSAVVGKPAPEIQLTSVQGKRVRLSQFKGQKAVVLVFIYGDT